MPRLTTATLLIALLTTMSSCEGFKVLTLYNTSQTEAIVITRPSLLKENGYRISNYPELSARDSSSIVLKPDSVLLLSSIFTGLLLNNRLKEQDLRITYLKIETPKKIIEARNKTEIITLLRGIKHTEGRPLSSKNFQKIVIRPE